MIMKSIARNPVPRRMDHAPEIKAVGDIAMRFAAPPS
jgi:hypothetical protein